MQVAHLLLLLATRTTIPDSDSDPPANRESNANGISMTDASGKPVQDRGKYVEIFKKQADGTWKVIVDIWNSDLPAASDKK